MNSNEERAQTDLIYKYLVLTDVRITWLSLPDQRGLIFPQRAVICLECSFYDAI